jgi:hypothetical protein
VKSVCSGRSISTSLGCGSFTFKTMSASLKIASASATISAPCAA